MAAMTYKSWTDTEEEALFSAVASKVRLEDLSKEVGRSASSLQSKMSRLGLRSKAKNRDAGAAIRDCMCCKRRFHSSHIGNRICEACKATFDTYA